MDAKSNIPEDTSDREISTARVFDAPRELVWRVWTEPDHIAKWWGPNGFTNTINSMDVRPGGVWDFVMHGPDGTNYKNKIIYREVVEPELLAYSHVSGPLFECTVTFTGMGTRTSVSMRMIFQTISERDDTVTKYGAVEGLNQTFNHLAQHLASVVSNE